MREYQYTVNMILLYLTNVHFVNVCLDQKNCPDNKLQNDNDKRVAKIIFKVYRLVHKEWKSSLMLNVVQ